MHVNGPDAWPDTHDFDETEDDEVLIFTVKCYRCNLVLACLSEADYDEWKQYPK